MKIYRSGYFNLILYWLITIAVLIPGLWILLYSFSKHNYNWPIIIAGSILCSYQIFILQKQCSYRIIVKDDFLEISFFDNIKSIAYKDIVDFKLKRNACYIIDKYQVDGEYFVRGTKPLLKYSSNNQEVKINTFKLPVIQKYFLENYDELIKALICKLNENTDIEALKEKLPYNSTSSISFVSLALLKSNQEKVTISEAINVLSPYIMMIFIFLMSIYTYGAANKGLWSDYMPIYVKLIFPIITIIGTYFLTIKFVNYIKNSMNRQIHNPSIKKFNLIVFITINIIISAAVIMLFFFISNHTPLKM
jgi:hypothetical protein